MIRSPRSIALLTALRAQLARDNATPEASGMFSVDALLGRPSNVYDDAICAARMAAFLAQ